MDPATAPDVTPLRVALDVLAEQVDGLAFALPASRQDDRRAVAASLRRSIREYLQPRLADLGAPAVVAVVGSTGAGKSTLVNALAGEPVAPAGAVRPTTTAPLVWTHRDHVERYGDDFLPDFRAAAADQGLQVVAHDEDAMRGVTVVDTPDVDSVVIAHRELADQLLAVADLCIWVTTAQRYADAVPWEVLREVRDRDLPLVVVCNRVPAEGGETIVDDLLRRLVDERVLRAGDEVDLITVRELASVAATGMLPPEAVGPLRARLERLTAPAVRSRVVAAAVEGNVDAAVRSAEALADAVEAERGEIAALRKVAHTAYGAQRDDLIEALASGRLIQQEVLARWQEFVGTGELVRSLAKGAGRVRAWARRVLGGVAERSETVKGEARSELAALISRRADRAAITTATAWERDPAGSQLLHGGLWRADPATDLRAAELLDDWIADLAGLVEEEGQDRKRAAQVASVGVNVVAASLMLAVFAHTGGLTGAEVGITAGAAAVQQRLLEHLFGAAAARRLVEDARTRLLDGAGAVLEQDRQRFDNVLDGIGPDEDAADQLRQAAVAVASATSILGLGDAHD